MLENVFAPPRPPQYGLIGAAGFQDQARYNQLELARRQDAILAVDRGQRFRISRGLTLAGREARLVAAGYDDLIPTLREITKTEPDDFVRGWLRGLEEA